MVARASQCARLPNPLKLHKLVTGPSLGHGPGMTTEPEVSPVAAALAGRCPQCGKGRLFKNVLELRPVCESCGFDTAAINSGDGPAVFVILILGALMLGSALYVEFTFLPPWWVHVVLWGLLTPLFALGFLRFLKALLVGQIYKHKAEEGRFSKD